MMKTTRLIVPVLLIIGFCGCKSAPREKEAAALIREANGILAQSTKKTNEWTVEYMKAFNSQSRAQFPANRELLRTRGDNIARILNEDSRLNSEAIQKYEQAAGLITNEQQRRGVTLLTSSLKKTLDLNELFKAQVQLASDETIVDEKTFNQRFMQITQQITQAAREKQAQYDEGKRLLGM